MLRSLKRVAATGAVIAMVTVSLQGVASAAVPTVPADLVAVPGNESVALTWTASSNTPTDYVIEYSADGFVTTTNLFYEMDVSTAVTATVNGLSVPLTSDSQPRNAPPSPSTAFTLTMSPSR